MDMNKDAVRQQQLARMRHALDRKKEHDRDRQSKIEKVTGAQESVVPDKEFELYRPEYRAITPLSPFDGRQSSNSIVQAVLDYLENRTVNTRRFPPLVPPGGFAQAPEPRRLPRMR